MGPTPAGWVLARGQLMFLIGLVVAAAIIIKVESAEFIPASEVAPVSSLLRPALPDEVAAAWRRAAEMDAAPAADAGALGDAIRAALAAHRLDLIDGRELHRRVSGIIERASRMDPMAAEVSGGAARFLAALELVAWGGYPSLRARATAELLRWSAAADAPADRLMRAALLSMGEGP